jgi:hypothetical protein
MGEFSELDGFSTSKPRVKALCECGHEGVSANPQMYRCGYCYYTRWAEGLEKEAVKLRERASKKEEKAAECTRRAVAFRKKHPR